MTEISTKLEAAGLRVRQLEWERVNDESYGIVGWIADSVVGHYVIQARDGSDSLWWEVTRRHGGVYTITDSEDEDDAKAAAQSCACESWMADELLATGQMPTLLVAHLPR